MKKRLTALFLVLTLVLTLFGCAAETGGKDKRDSEETFVAFDKDADEMKDPLTICMDLEYARELIGSAEPAEILNEFLYTLEESGGLSDVEILYVPKHGADREAVLDRIRVEIMSGGGPDVFIMNCYGSFDIWNTTGSDPLIAFPEQAMKNGLFLPLDEYMENNTRFTQWDKQNQAVLSAGRDEEGQQIIPLSYTLPIICFSKSDVDIDLTGKNYTWEDMLSDPEISPYARLLADSATPHWYGKNEVSIDEDGSAYMEYILGEITDFEEEELRFTEEELLQRVQEVLSLCNELREASETMEKDTMGDMDYFCSFVGSDLFAPPVREDDIRTEEPLTMLPLYSDDGGVTASILSWAAVNRNTDRPEEAYTVIDLLMRDHVQKGYWLYESFLCGNTAYAPRVGIPLHEDILRPEMPFGHSSRLSLTEENYNEWCEVRDQITGANFQSKVGLELRKLMGDCFFGSAGRFGYENFNLEEEVHEAYEEMQRLVRE